MPIETSNPKIVPASEEKTYDKYFVTFFQIRGADPNKPVTADIHLRLGKVDKDGVWELDPDEPTVKITIADLFTLAAQDETTRTALESTLGAIQAIAASQNKIR